jgi:hypothetical protein
MEKVFTIVLKQWSILTGSSTGHFNNIGGDRGSKRMHWTAAFRFAAPSG